MSTTTTVTNKSDNPLTPRRTDGGKTRTFKKQASI